MVPGAMSGGRSIGPRSRAACTESAKAAAVAGGTLLTQADSISLTRSVSATRRSRSRRECFVIRTSLRVQHQHGVLDCRAVYAPATSDRVSVDASPPGSSSQTSALALTSASILYS